MAPPAPVVSNLLRDEVLTFGRFVADRAIAGMQCWRGFTASPEEAVPAGEEVKP